jgi:predicted phage terminase large subunit-like protein
LLGIGGDVIVLDDPHNTRQAESEAERLSALTWWSEISATRLNNPRESAIVVIMQRLHEDDISGVILSSERSSDWCHLCIPMSYEQRRHCVTATSDSPRALQEFAPHAHRGVGLARSTRPVWGIFAHPELRRTRIILIDAWRKHLQMHGAPTPRLEDEVVKIGDTPQVVRRKGMLWEKRVGHEWGLVEWVAQTCRKWGVQKLLVENKASGITAAQELRRLHGREGWAVQLVDPKGSDKVARALAVQPLFASGLIYAPDRAWVEMWMTELCLFPKARHDDLVDSTTQALKYLRDVGAVQFDDEVAAEEADRVRLRPRLQSLYPC